MNNMISLQVEFWTQRVDHGRWSGSWAVLAFLLALTAGSVWTGQAHAQARIDVGVHDLLPDTAGQAIRLDVQFAEQLVRGMNVRAELGDGAGPLSEPIFEGADFNTDVWAAYPVTILGGAVAGAEQFLQSSVNFSATGESVIPNGTVVELQISTVGILEGVYPLTLSSQMIGEDTDLILPGGQTVVPELLDGQLRIVPEPTSSWVTLFVVLPWATRYWRKRQHSR